MTTTATIPDSDLVFRRDRDGRRAPTHLPVRAERVRPGYWRVTFDNAPFNLYDPEVEAALAEIVGRLEADPGVKVVVFDSALPDFFMAHLNLGTRRSSRPAGRAWRPRTRASPACWPGSRSRSAFSRRRS